MNPAQQYILEKTEPFQSILLHLDATVRHVVPEVDLKYKWKLPFYYLNNTMFCFLNFRKKFVDLGIPYGNQLSNSSGSLLAGEGRKQLRSLRYQSLTEIDDDELITILEELKKLDIFAAKSRP